MIETARGAQPVAPLHDGAAPHARGLDEAEFGPARTVLTQIGKDHILWTKPDIRQFGPQCRAAVRRRDKRLVTPARGCGNQLIVLKNSVLGPER